MLILLSALSAMSVLALRFAAVKFISREAGSSRSRKGNIAGIVDIHRV